MAEEIKIRVSADGTETTVGKLKEVEAQKEKLASGTGTSNSGAGTAPGWSRRQSTMPTDYRPLFEGGKGKDAPAPEKRADAIARQRLELAEMERERLAHVSGGRSGEAKELEEIIAARKLALTYQTQGKMAEVEANLLAEKHVALQREAAAARAQAAAAAKAEAEADAVDAAEGGGKGKGGFNGSALRGGRTASVLRAVGVPAAIANPIAAAVTAALATVVAVLKIRSNDIGLARGQEIQQEEREYSTYKSEREAATSVGEAEVQLTDKPIAAIDARNKIRERKRDLIEDSKNALPDQLPTGDWFDVFHPQKVMGKLLQFLDPRSGPNPHRDQDLKEIRDLDRQEMRASQITGPLTAEGRRAKMYYDQLVSAGADQTDAARIAKDAARRGDLERMGTATQGGARLASVAQQQADLAQGDVVRAIQDLPGRFAQEVASQLQRQHENPNARGPGGVMIHGAHVQGVSGW